MRSSTDLVTAESARAIEPRYLMPTRGGVKEGVSGVDAGRDAAREQAGVGQRARPVALLDALLDREELALKRFQVRLDARVREAVRVLAEAIDVDLVHTVDLIEGLPGDAQRGQHPHD